MIWRAILAAAGWVLAACLCVRYRDAKRALSTTRETAALWERAAEQKHAMLIEELHRNILDADPSGPRPQH